MQVQTERARADGGKMPTHLTPRQNRLLSRRSTRELEVHMHAMVIPKRVYTAKFTIKFSRVTLLALAITGHMSGLVSASSHGFAWTASGSCYMGTYLNSANRCMVCPTGTWSGGNDVTTCVQCPDGMNTSGTGSFASYNCLCPTGKFNVNDTCVVCPIGTYNPWMGQYMCDNCTAGKTTMYNGTADSNLCLPNCAAGQTISGTSCIPCAQNTYKSETGLASCTDCPDFSSSPTGTTAVSNCVCHAGYARDNNICTACEVGKYKMVAGNTLCTSCPSGKSTLSEATDHSNQCYQKCSPGLFWSVDRCFVCPANTYKYGTNLQECEDCPSLTSSPPQSYRASECVCNAGYYGSAGSCTDCPVGTYKFEAGLANSCINCVAGKTTVGQRSTSRDDCVENCLPGTTFSAGSCIPCAQNTDKQETGLVACTPCPDNTGSVAGSVACSCGTGYYWQGPYWSDGGWRGYPGECKLCPLNTYKDYAGQATACDACSTGHITASTGSSQCVENFYPVQHPVQKIHTKVKLV